MVSGFPVPSHKTWSYPDDLMRRLDSAVGGYEIDVPLTKPKKMKGGEKAYLPQVQRLHDKTLPAGELLMGWYKPELFLMKFPSIKLVHHNFSKYIGDQYSP